MSEKSTHSSIKAKTKKEKHILVASNKSTNLPNEYLKTCSRCKNPVYLTDNWGNYKIDEIICNDCFKKFNKKYKILITDNVLEHLNKDWGANFTKKELEKTAIAIKNEDEEALEKFRDKIPDKIKKKMLGKFIEKELKKSDAM